MSNKEIILSNFETILTFDRLDAEKYNLKFRPLFARKTQQISSKEIKYDISFVGYMHSLRYQVLHNLKKQLDAKDLRYIFLLRTGKFNKWYMINISHKIHRDDSDMILTEQMPYESYIDILNKSNVILDISHPNQSGLTMRTIESLNAGKKLLTTNSDIINYNFNKDQYRVWNLGDVIDYDFLNLKLKFNSNMSSYSIENFVEDLLNS